MTYENTSTSMIDELIELSAEIKRLQAQEKILKNLVFEAMKEKDLDSLAGETAAISITTRKKYQYSEAVTTAETSLKAMKKSEEAAGASFTKTEYLTVRHHN